MKSGLSPILTSNDFKHHYDYLNWGKGLGSQCHEKNLF